MWAIDIGTTNTGIARWDDVGEKSQLLELPHLCRDHAANDPLQAPRMVPSATSDQSGHAS
jgi:hypothetical protein